MRIAVVHPGVAFGTGDVAAGLTYGLKQLGVEVGLACVDVVIAVTAIRPPGFVDAILETGVPVTALFTESPYEQAAEVQMAGRVAGCWTHERTAVSTFRAVQPHVAYLPHAWHPLVHTATPQPGDDQLPAHDVVFVGAGVRERIAFFNAIDWTGIDLGLYGIWDGLGLKDALTPCIKSEGPVANTTAAALYRRARIGLNLYRRLPVLGPDRPTLRDLGQDVPANWVQAESLNPRAYELAACGCFQLSDSRSEIPDVFGCLVPTFGTMAGSVGDEIRSWLRWVNLRGDADRADLQGMVAGHSWIDRAGQVLRDLQTWGLTA
jgi:spore maturation protein CgeB